MIDDAIVDCTMLVSGHDAFVLHDTYGFPFELTREIASEKGVAADTVGFEREMEEQRARARADAASKRAVVELADLPASVPRFHGYEGLEADAAVVALLRDGKPVATLEPGRKARSSSIARRSMPKKAVRSAIAGRSPARPANSR